MAAWWPASIRSATRRCSTRPPPPPDVNVLVAASRSDHPHHQAAYAWLDQALAACAEGRSLKLMPMVVASFLRRVTHPKIFREPTPIKDAVDFIDALLAIPGVDMPPLGPEWPLLRDLCLAKGLTANDLPDAWLAAAVNQLGEHLVTSTATSSTCCGVLKSRS